MKKRQRFSALLSQPGKILLLIIPAIFSTFSSGTLAQTEQNTAESVATIVTGIISYTRWPQLQGLPRLCLFSSATWSLRLAEPHSGQPYSPVIVKDIGQALIARCDAVYFGTETPQQQLQLQTDYQGRPQLYIAERNPDCSVGSAFCLNIAAGKVSFAVNLDSLSRSGVRVNPDVLMLAHGRNRPYE